MGNHILPVSQHWMWPHITLGHHLPKNENVSFIINQTQNYVIQTHMNFVNTLVKAFMFNAFIIMPCKVPYTALHSNYNQS